VEDNNRAYYNDWNHQIVMARTRGTDLSRAHIGMDLFGPASDFAGLAGAQARGRTGQEGHACAGRRGDAAPLRPKWIGGCMATTPSKNS